jgi:hypothetical protein
MTCDHGYIGTCPEGCDYDIDYDPDYPRDETLAEEISTALGNDGQRWEAADGRRLNELVAAVGGQSIQGEADDYRHELPDGSCIVETQGGWDLALDPTPGSECYCWLGAGPEHNASCPVCPAEATS